MNKYLDRVQVEDQLEKRAGKRWDAVKAVGSKLFSKKAPAPRGATPVAKTPEWKQKQLDTHNANRSAPASDFNQAKRQVRTEQRAVHSPKPGNVKTTDSSKKLARMEDNARSLNLPQPGTAAAARQSRQAAEQKASAGVTSEQRASQQAAAREANTARVTEKKPGFFSKFLRGKPSYEVKQPAPTPVAAPNAAATPAKKPLTEGQKDAIKIGGGVVGGAVLMSALSKKPQEQTPQTPYY